MPTARIMRTAQRGRTAPLVISAQGKRDARPGETARMERGAMVDRIIAVARVVKDAPTGRTAQGRPGVRRTTKHALWGRFVRRVARARRHAQRGTRARRVETARVEMRAQPVLVVPSKL